MGEICPSVGELPPLAVGDVGKLSLFSSISNKVLDVSTTDEPSSESVRLSEGVKEELESWEEEGESDPCEEGIVCSIVS